MKAMKALSLLLIATSLASGAVYARGGGGMSGGNANHAQRTEAQAQTRTQTRTQTRDGSQANDAQRNEYREMNRHENREQIRSEGASSLNQ